jgi:hypothetical protein
VYYKYSGIASNLWSSRKLQKGLLLPLREGESKLLFGESGEQLRKMQSL